MLLFLLGTLIFPTENYKWAEIEPLIKVINYPFSLVEQLRKAAATEKIEKKKSIKQSWMKLPEIFFFSFTY